jgi:hypothetical protein
MAYAIKIKRQPSQETQTLGNFTLFVDDTKVYKGVTLELPWRENRRQISCIPAGTYDLELWQSKRFGNCLHVMNVPGRDAILIHTGNYDHNTHGCILVGKQFTDLDKDGYLDITESRITLNNIMAFIKGNGVIEIS